MSLQGGNCRKCGTHYSNSMRLAEHEDICKSTKINDDIIAESQKKGIVATIEDGKVKISFVNMEASDALAVIAGIIVKVSESTGVSPSHSKRY